MTRELSSSSNSDHDIGRRGESTYCTVCVSGERTEAKVPPSHSENNQVALGGQLLD